MALQSSFADVHRAVKPLNQLTHAYPAEGEQGDARPVCFSSPMVDKRPSHGGLSAMFLTILYFLLVISLFEMAPKCSAECGLLLPKHRKAVMGLMEPRRVTSHELVMPLAMKPMSTSNRICL